MENIKDFLSNISGLVVLIGIFVVVAIINGFLKKYTGISWVEFTYILIGVGILATFIGSCLDSVKKSKHKEGERK